MASLPSSNGLFVALLIAVVISHRGPTLATRTRGVWYPKPTERVRFVANFAFDKTDPHHVDQTKGYVYGNVTAVEQDLGEQPYATLALVNRAAYTDITDLIEGQSNDDVDICGRIFELIDNSNECSSNGSIGRNLCLIPCRSDSLCLNFKSVSVAGAQFSLIVDESTPTFHFLLLLACVPRPDSSKEGTGCNWTNTPDDRGAIAYDLHLVNGKPSVASGNLFTFQFSYEKQDMVLYLVMAIVYPVLAMAQSYALAKQRHRNLLVYIFATSLYLHILVFAVATTDKLIYAYNGEGVEALVLMADVFRIVSLAIFILFALIVAKGWPMTREEVTAKPLLVVTWIIYLTIEVLLYAWTRKSLDIALEVDEYSTLPGWFSLGIRIVIMMWFLFELRATMMLEQDQQRLRFYLHFGAGIMVWFVHLPIVAIIGLQIPLIWRYKLILGFSFGANFLAFAVVANFMWPTKRSYHFLTHQVEPGDFSEELEYYEDQPTTGSADSLGRLTIGPYGNLNAVNNPFVFENRLHDSNGVKA